MRQIGFYGMWAGGPRKRLKCRVGFRPKPAVHRPLCLASEDRLRIRPMLLEAGRKQLS